MNSSSSHSSIIVIEILLTIRSNYNWLKLNLLILLRYYITVIMTRELRNILNLINLTILSCLFPAIDVLQWFNRLHKRAMIPLMLLAFVYLLSNSIDIGCWLIINSVSYRITYYLFGTLLKLAQIFLIVGDCIGIWQSIDFILEK